MQAARVEDKVRESWNLALFGDWTKQKTKAAFAELECLALLVPNNQKTLSRLHEDSAGKGELEFPERAFLKSVNKYRGSILQKKEEQDKSKGSTKYLKRRYKDRSTGQETANIEELVLKDEAVFLRGVSGSGKGTVTSRVLTEWAEGTLLKSVVCCLKISAGFKEETSLNKMFCDQPEFLGSDSFDQFEKLAFDGKLAIIFERVDNLGRKGFKIPTFKIPMFKIPRNQNTNRLDHNDGQFFRAMEWLMFFFRPPLTSMVFQWF